MKMMQATAKFIHHDIGAKRPRDLFWCSDEQAIEFEQMGIAVPAEGKAVPLAYATKVEPWSVQPAAQAFAERMLTTAENEAGPSGQPTPVGDSDVMDSTPATISGGNPTPKRRGRPPSAGRRTSKPANDSA